MTHAIVTERLTKYYGPRCVVNCLDLRVPAGSVYGFLGRNGAGKSTTIKMLLGMAQPSSGRVELLGHEVATLPAEVRGRIAYLAEGHPLYGWMTVAEAGRFCRAFHADRWNQPLLDQILEHFEIRLASEAPPVVQRPARQRRRWRWRSLPIPTCSFWTIRPWDSTRSPAAIS